MVYERVELKKSLGIGSRLFLFHFHLSTLISSFYTICKNVKKKKKKKAYYKKYFSTYCIRCSWYVFVELGHSTGLSEIHLKHLNWKTSLSLFATSCNKEAASL